MKVQSFPLRVSFPFLPFYFIFLLLFIYFSLFVCMSFIFHKSFTRYGNSHVTNNKKHSNIEYHYTWLRESLLAIKNTIKLNTYKIQETDLKYITHHTTYKIELWFTAFVTTQFTSLIIGNISEREIKNMDKLILIVDITL